MRVESRAFDRWWAGHAYLLVVGMVGGDGGSGRLEWLVSSGVSASCSEM